MCYVLCKQNGFCTGKNLPLHLHPFLLQIVFKEYKCGMNVNLLPSTTTLCVRFLEPISGMRNVSVNDSSGITDIVGVASCGEA